MFRTVIKLETRDHNPKLLWNAGGKYSNTFIYVIYSIVCPLPVAANFLSPLECMLYECMFAFERVCAACMACSSSIY